MRSLLRKLGLRAGARPAPSLFDLLNGYRTTCLLMAAGRLGLFERPRAGPIAEADLSASLGAHAPSLARLLRALQALRLLERRAGSVVLTARGRALLEGNSAAPDALRLIAAEYLPAWLDLRHSVLTGEPAFEHAFGTTVWEHRRDHPELNESFNRYMQGNERALLEALPAAVDFSRCGEVVDVGAGNGHLIAAILSAHPHVRGCAFDRPHVVEGAAPSLEAAGVRDRCRLVGGSFLASVPAGGDLYILQKVLHNWDDDSCGRILGACRAAVKADGRLLVVEALLPEAVDADIEIAMRDLHMLALHRGRKRTAAELERLLANAGFALARRSRVAPGVELLEAVTR